MKETGNWKRIEALLDELLELAPGDRTARLDALSAEDAALRPQLERLLREDGAASAGILDRGVATVAGRVMGEAEAPSAENVAGKRIGPYRVIRELGRGGMGEVLLAERAEGDFDHLVALKIVREGMREGIVERFRHERRILARLRHPNIAALYDGGTTDEGVPYFAMEYVEGERIHDYCDRNRLSVDQRIDLFDSVCRAVQHAHRNLVVHRDLKPGNVLVAADGTVKLLDFGIAKVVEADDDEDATVTGRFMTPAFAAPEQVAGEATSTATDVYALGALLYMLLTGHNPHGDTSRALEVARAVLERDTPPPSTVAGRDTPTETGEEIARRRGAQPSQLRRRFRGDLDNILRKALQKRPEDRYSSAEDLRLDLQRHRRAVPVEARPATVGYRFGRFARRNRVGVAAGTVVAVTALAGVAGVAWQSGVAAHERDQAQAVKEYLISMFSAADPEFESGESLTALDIVERGARSVADRLAGEPEIRAEVTQILGTVMSRLAQYDRADSLLERALAAHRKHGDLERAAETLVELGDVARWQGRLDDADSLAGEAVRSLRDAGREDGAVVAHGLSLRGSAATEQARYDDAKAALEEAIGIARAAGDGRSLGRYLENLAVAHSYSGELDQSERFYREAIESYREHSDEVGAARGMASLGDLLDDRDRPAEAEELLREAVRVLRREYGEAGHPQLAAALANLGGMYRAQNRLDEAEPVQRESVEMFRRHLGNDHYYVARAINNLSLTVARRGDIEGSVELLREAIATIRRGLGDHHPALASPLTNLGNKLSALGKYAEAETALREALAVYEEAAGPEHYTTAYALNGLAGVMVKTGRYRKAEEFARRSLAIRSAALGASHSQTVWARREWAQSLARLGRMEDAVTEMDGAVQDARDGLPSTQRELARTLLERALIGEEMGEPASALEPVLREALKLRVELYGSHEPPTEEVRDALARIVSAGD